MISTGFHRFIAIKQILVAIGFCLPSGLVYICWFGVYMQMPIYVNICLYIFGQKLKIFDFLENEKDQCFKREVEYVWWKGNQRGSIEKIF